MALRLELTPSATGIPLGDMTRVTSVTLHVVRGDGSIDDPWSTVAVGSASPDLAVFEHVYGPADLVDVETLTITALMTLDDNSVVPSEPFELFVEP